VRFGEGCSLFNGMAEQHFASAEQRKAQVAETDQLFARTYK
jgi:hypothetical protein